MAIILAYLIYPLASLLDKRTPLSWRGSVSIIFLILLLILLGLLTVGGMGLVQQVQSLIRIIRSILRNCQLLLRMFPRSICWVHSGSISPRST